MSKETSIYILKTKADADACKYRLEQAVPPFAVSPVISTGEAYVAGYPTTAYSPTAAPDWEHLARAQPGVFVVVASR